MNEYEQRRRLVATSIHDKYQKNKNISQKSKSSQQNNSKITNPCSPNSQKFSQNQQILKTSQSNQQMFKQIHDYSQSLQYQEYLNAFQIDNDVSANLNFKQGDHTKQKNDLQRSYKNSQQSIRNDKVMKQQLNRNGSKNNLDHLLKVHQTIFPLSSKNQQNQRSITQLSQAFQSLGQKSTEQLSQVNNYSQQVQRPKTKQSYQTKGQQIDYKPMSDLRKNSQKGKKNQTSGLYSPHKDININHTKKDSLKLFVEENQIKNYMLNKQQDPQQLGFINTQQVKLKQNDKVKKKTQRESFLKQVQKINYNQSSTLDSYGGQLSKQISPKNNKSNYQFNNSRSNQSKVQNLQSLHSNDQDSIGQIRKYQKKQQEIIQKIVGYGQKQQINNIKPEVMLKHQQIADCNRKLFRPSSLDQLVNSKDIEQNQIFNSSKQHEQDRATQIFYQTLQLQNRYQQNAMQSSEKKQNQNQKNQFQITLESPQKENVESDKNIQVKEYDEICSSLQLQGILKKTQKILRRYQRKEREMIDIQIQQQQQIDILKKKLSKYEKVE